MEHDEVGMVLCDWHARHATAEAKEAAPESDEECHLCQIEKDLKD